jgi:hypothetical protein
MRLTFENKVALITRAASVSHPRKYGDRDILGSSPFHHLAVSCLGKVKSSTSVFTRSF